MPILEGCKQACKYFLVSESTVPVKEKSVMNKDLTTTKMLPNYNTHRENRINVFVPHKGSKSYIIQQRKASLESYAYREERWGRLSLILDSYVLTAI